jgi:hypothetical protein
MLKPVYGIEVKDDSLGPEFPSGSVLIVQTDTWDEIEEDDLAVFPRGNGNHLGRVHFEGGKVRLESLKKGEEALLLGKRSLRRLERVLGVDFP